MTLGALLFARGLAFFVADNGNKVFLIPDDAWFNQLGQGELLGLSFPIWVAGIAFVLAWIVFNRTRVRQRRGGHRRIRRTLRASWACRSRA